MFRKCPAQPHLAAIAGVRYCVSVGPDEDSLDGERPTKIRNVERSAGPETRELEPPEKDTAGPGSKSVDSEARILAMPTTSAADLSTLRRFGRLTLGGCRLEERCGSPSRIPSGSGIAIQ